jgi:hypothetical protein
LSVLAYNESSLIEHLKLISIITQVLARTA